MGKPHPIELRERVVAYVDEGHSHRAAARHFRVSIKFVNDLIKLRRETGGLQPRPMGKPKGSSKLNGLQGWVRLRLKEKSEITLDELCVELLDTHNITVHRSTVGRWLYSLGYSHKKNTSRH